MTGLSARPGLPCFLGRPLRPGRPGRPSCPGLPGLPGGPAI